MEGKHRNALLLIDANALVHRFFHALPPFTAPDGTPTNALYGISGVLLKMFKEWHPEYIAAAFDRPEPTFRETEYKEYKANRPTTPNEIISQIITAHDVFKWFGIKTFELPGFEADDIIGTLAEKFKSSPELKDGKVVILSGDNDLLQLVEGEKVMAEIIKTGVTETKTYNEAAVVEKYGLKPAQLPDYKGLVGDTSDNIPGVAGIGPKTASTLLKEFGNLEELFDSLAIVGNKGASKKLEGKKEEGLLSKRLATIKRDVPISIKSLKELEIPPLDKKSLKEHFQKLGFRTLIERMDK